MCVPFFFIEAKNLKSRTNEFPVLKNPNILLFDDKPCNPTIINAESHFSFFETYRNAILKYGERDTFSKMSTNSHLLWHCQFWSHALLPFLLHPVYSAWRYVDCKIQETNSLLAQNCKMGKKNFSIKETEFQINEELLCYNAFRSSIYRLCDTSGHVSALLICKDIFISCSKFVIGKEFKANTHSIYCYIGWVFCCFFLGESS